LRRADKLTVRAAAAIAAIEVAQNLLANMMTAQDASRGAVNRFVAEGAGVTYSNRSARVNWGRASTWENIGKTGRVPAGRQACGVARRRLESPARQECTNMTESTAAKGMSDARRSAAALQAELTVIVVSWNTRELTLRCLETLFDNTPDLEMKVIVVDNNSEDGSPDEIAKRFPQAHLIRNPGDFGFARANNVAMEIVDTEWVLLLNPDTEVRPNAINNLLSFSKKHPEAGITGGRTVFRDGSLNIASAWNKMTPWSLFCFFTGLSVIFSQTTFFNPEAIGGWKRDTERHVDIVQGSFFMIPSALWRKLGGFHPRYFMYGEEADLCLRAQALGYRPMITPTAEIMHLGGAAAPRGVRMLQLWRSKATFVRGHWSSPLVPVGLCELWLCCASRRLGTLAASKLLGRSSQEEVWRMMWEKRNDWLQGY
jgi:N-acetylglucosaminyl-diphospho-decaprenol L-rhamnosyltransferase